MRKHLPWTLASACVLIIVSGACGRKTDPVIPDSPRPAMVSGIKVEARGGTAWLSWQIPDRNVEGKSINAADIVQFRIYRTEIGRDTKRGRFKLLAEIDMTNPAPAMVRNTTVTWSDERLKFGQSYAYRIRAVSARGGLSKLSDEIIVTPAHPLAVPVGVEAVSGDNFNVISWSTVTTWMDGQPARIAARYNVYRGTERGRYDQTPLNKQPLAEPPFKDGTALNNHTYYYVVRSVAESAPPWNESPDSAVASATPLDRTPPAKPAGLTVLAGVNRVFLTWNENRENDLAGYHLYRSTGSGRNFVRLNDKLLTRTTFSDDTVKSGNTYHYAVTAVDKSGNESARSDEKSAYIEVLR
ncbi:MAG TPA: hypothetical protein VK654_01545 [Nitrospirota bacterium]|nr:hypothetical protein [Nitrospirota bacterium]